MSSRWKHQRRLRVFDGGGDLIHDSGWRERRGGLSTALVRIKQHDEYVRRPRNHKLRCETYTHTAFFNGHGWRFIAVQFK